MTTTSTTYSTVARALHWLIAILIVGQLAGGFFMGHLDVPQNMKYTMFQLHKSFGFLVLIFSVFRLYWRLTHKTPALPAGMPGWQKGASHAVHWLLYLLMIAVPFSGWALVSSSPYQIATKLFFVIPVPHLPLPVSESVSHSASEAHEIMAFAMLGLLVLHIAAALKHFIINKDGVLESMAPTPSSPVGWAARGLIALYLFGGLGALFLGMLFLGGDHEEEEREVAQTEVAAPIGENGWAIIADETYVRLTGSAFGADQIAMIPEVTIDIILDPENPTDAGSIQAVLDLTSLKGNGETPSALKGSSWFDVSAYPTAQFVAEDIVLGAEAGLYIATGTLTIKDVSAPLELPFRLDIAEDGTAKASATVTVLKQDFGLGENATGVGAEVVVDVRVAATPAE